MAEYLSPGVYIEEFEIGARPIEGVSTSTAGFLGEAQRGPTIPRLVTSWSQYQRVFGSYFGATKYLPYAVQGFFENGGQRCYIARIVKSGDGGAATASLVLSEANGSDALTVSAVGEGSWGNQIALKLGPGTFEGFKLSVFYWKTAPSSLYDPELDTATTPRPTVEEVFDDLSLDEVSPNYYEKRVNGISNLIEISQESTDTGNAPEAGHMGTAQGAAQPTITLDPGASGTDDAYNGMEVQITAGTGSGQTRTITDYDGATNVATVDEAWSTVPDATSTYDVVDSGVVQDTGTALGGTQPSITLDSAAASAINDAYNGMRIRITSGAGSGQINTIVDYDGATNVATVADVWTTLPDSTSRYHLYWLMALVAGADAVATAGVAQGGTAMTITLATGASAQDDAYNGMEIAIARGTGNGQTRTITDYTGANREATLDSAWDTTPDSTSQYRVLDPTAPTLDQGDYTRTDTDIPGERRGLTGFAAIDDISIVYTPNPQDISGLAGALISHCEILQDRFAIIDASLGSATITNIDPRGNTTEPNAAGNTQYAAFYYPWIRVIDPEAGLRRLVPPGGHMAGIYARSDTERGVHKAPANEVVRGAVDLEFQVTKGEQDILNPRGVNVIRAFPGRGIYVWGARTLSTNTLWKYINVRRLFLFLEESIDEGTQWVVFEPNDPKLWGRVKATVTEFLTRVWKDGALFGNTPEEAFFVKVDETTMTTDDITNGRLIILIGVAPVRPAEFVIFRIAQLTRSPE